MGKLLRSELEKLNSPLIKLVRGRGLLNAIVINHKDPEVSWDLCLHLRDLGLLAKPTHGDKIRFAPPLIITEDQIKEAVSIIGAALNRLS
jgi:ornithine--oxo-acid transaminase